MPSVSIIMLGSTSPTADFATDKFKGDGFHGYADGLHTVAWFLANFVGTIQFQGALTKDPVEADWADIPNASVIAASSLTQNAHLNFTGNYVWVRAKITDFTAGTITQIQYNN